MDGNVDCPFCDNQLKTIDHLFVQCPFIKVVWSAIMGYCPIPISIHGNHQSLD